MEESLDERSYETLIARRIEWDSNKITINEKMEIRIPKRRIYLELLSKFLVERKYFEIPLTYEFFSFLS